MTHQEFLQFKSKNPATYTNHTDSFLTPKDPSLGQEPALWYLGDRRNCESKMEEGKDGEGWWNGIRFE